MKNRASEVAKKAISSPLLESSIDGAKGVLMNITGGSNLSLFEVQEADIVASASDEEVNMIFGSVINENLKDEIIVTVIATGFTEEALQQQRPTAKPTLNMNRQSAPQQQAPIREQRQEMHVQHEHHVKISKIMHRMTCLRFRHFT